MCAAETYTILIVFGYPYLYIIILTVHIEHQPIQYRYCVFLFPWWRRLTCITIRRVPHGETGAAGGPLPSTLSVKANDSS